jgi:class 3 adenylate cyclase
VNTAARLESFHKEDASSPARDGRTPLFRILIGDSTRRHLGDGEFELEDLGVHVLRGRAGPVRIFRVWGTLEAERAG